MGAAFSFLSNDQLFHSFLASPQSLLTGGADSLAAQRVGDLGTQGRPAVPRADKAPGATYGGSSGPVGEVRDAMVYYEKVSQLSLSAQFLGQMGGAGGTDSEFAAGDAANQLYFEFFAESRTEQLAFFQERTASTADRMDGAARETLVEASRRVAARFSMSVTLSGSALTSFAQSAEALPEADGETTEAFQAFIDQALELVDDLLGEVFDLLASFSAEEGGFQGELDRLLAELGQLGVHSARRG